MGRIGLTYQDVSNAASELQGRGVIPTVEKVRSVLKTGSNSTITEHLRAWKSQQGEMASLGVPQELASMVKGLWERLQSEAQRTIEKANEVAEKQIQDISNQLAEEAKSSQALQKRLLETEEKLSSEKSEIEKLRHELEEEKKAAAVLKSQMISLEKQSQTQKEENIKLHQLSQNLQKNWEHLEKSSQDKQAQLKSELDTLRQQSDHQIKLLTSEANQLTHQNTILENKVDQMTKEQKELKSDNLEVNKLLERKATELESLKKQLIQSNEEIKDKSNTIKEFENKIKEFEFNEVKTKTENKHLQEEANRLKGKIQLLESKHQEISAEKHMLEGRLQQMHETLTSKKTDDKQ